VTHTPPSASAGGYPPDTERDAAFLKPYATGDANPEGSPDSDEYPVRGHRSSRRPGPLRRLLRWREEPDTEEPGTSAPMAGRVTRGPSWLGDEPDDLDVRSPGYRAQHRARSEADPQTGPLPLPPGGGAEPSFTPAAGRFDSDQAAREHLSAFRPDDGTEIPWTEPGSNGPGTPPPGPFGSGRPGPGVPPAPGAAGTGPGMPGLAPAGLGSGGPGPAGPGAGTMGLGPGMAGPGGATAVPGPGMTGPGAGMAGQRPALPGAAGNAGMPGAGVPGAAGEAGLPGPGSPSAAAGQAPFPGAGQGPFPGAGQGPFPGARMPGAPVPPSPPGSQGAPPAAPGGPAGPAPAGSQADPLYRVLGGLAMRDLTLVESLLQVVEKLESHEEDPDQLELLFRIDHLATRMRRNSENLLVLAGHDTEGRDFEPVPLLDVARAAISEITDYSRAQITSLPDVRVIGLTADDLSHILAELLDNAMSKSPQSAAVVVRGERTGDGTLVLSVEDAGIGIPADRLADINARLSRAPVLDASATRHMGLYVVGRLAHRHGLRVQLRERPYGGITAHIVIPDELVRAMPGTSQSTSPGPLPSRVARADHPRPRPGLEPGSAPADVPIAGPSAAPGSPAAPGVPSAPRFQPADPATLPRRTPGQPSASAPANGMPVPGPAAPGRPRSGLPPAPGESAPGRPRSGPPPAPGGPGAGGPGAAQPPATSLSAPVPPAAPPAGGPPTLGPPPAGPPTRPPSPVSAVPEPGEIRAGRIRDELAGFQLGQRAARAGEAAPEPTAPFPAPPRRDPGPERPGRPSPDGGTRPTSELPVRQPRTSAPRGGSPGPAPGLPPRTPGGSAPGSRTDRPSDAVSPGPPGLPDDERWGRSGRPADEAGPEADET
jgi:hypothetical protein